jgi:hypothetical protein
MSLAAADKLEGQLGCSKVAFEGRLRDPEIALEEQAGEAEQRLGKW